MGVASNFSCISDIIYCMSFSLTLATGHEASTSTGKVEFFSVTSKCKVLLKSLTIVISSSASAKELTA
jgi:hypothetical protein